MEILPRAGDRGYTEDRTTCRIKLDRTLLTSYDTRCNSGSVREREIQICNCRIGLPGCPEFSIMNQLINQGRA